MRRGLADYGSAYLEHSCPSFQRSVVSGVFALVALVSCGAPNKEILAQYPTRHIDRPYTLPKGLKTWEPTVFAGYESVNREPETKFLPSPLLWRYPVSDGLNILFAPIPLQLDWQIFRHQRALLGSSAGVTSVGYSSLEDWTVESSFRVLYQRKLSDNLALRIEPGLDYTYRSTDQRSLTTSLSVGPLFQVTPTFAVSPFARAQHTGVSGAEKNRDQGNDSDRFGFPLGMWAGWRFHRLWELDVTYSFLRLGYGDYEGHFTTLGLTRYWGKEGPRGFLRSGESDAYSGPEAPRGVYLELPVVEYPFSFGRGFSFPSMGQSLWITTEFYEGLHFGLGKILDPYGSRFWRRFWAKVLISTVDILTTWLPPSAAWQHEEWHRAVMTNRGIGSFNDIYRLKFFSEFIPVTRVQDEDLVRLKRDHPADQVRLSTAGIEGSYELAANLEKVTFFHNTRTWNTFLLWDIYLENWLYMDGCADREADTETEKALSREGADISKRDFTGLDCTAWTYDLFRPNEPYEDRGNHPSGVGIDRYITFSDLSSEEQTYLKRQTNLSLLNFLDPHLLGFRRFSATNPFTRRPFQWNAALRHLPTAFGYDVRADIFIREDSSSMFFSFHSYFNDEGYFPGVEGHILRYPLKILQNGALPLTARLGLWLQPDRLRFQTKAAKAGAHASVRLGYPIYRYLEPYLELEGKTAGWVAGNVYLDENFTVRAGFASILH